MKLDVAVNEVVLSNVGTTGEFKIRNSAKAFKILSDGLYSNKIRAIIRELSCNALDSHVGADKATVPFEVHLPTILEPWFAVRDFGMGLNGDQVVNIYTTYFESTKTDSNAFIGALGLGSKSPFSYTENFTVTAIKDGYKRIYSAFINEAGVPSIAEMSEELTDEGNGVEVKFSVTDRYDYQSFRNEAHNVFEWFEHKPTITGVDSFEHKSPQFKEKNIVPGVHSTDGRNSSCVAVMGNIAYPLNNIPETQKHFGDLAALLECSLVMEFAIGELDFAASREQLSYIPLTLNSIRRKLEELNANLAIHLAAKADAITNEWERADFLYVENNSRLYKAAVPKYVADTKFPLFDTKSYHGKKTFTYTVGNLLKRGLAIAGFRRSYNTTTKIDDDSDYVNGNYVKTINIPVDKDVVIILNDLKTGCLTRARYHYSQTGKSATVYCVSHNDPDLAVRQVEYDKFIAELHTPPTILKASTLLKQERKKSVSTQGIATLVLKESSRSGYADSYKWIPYSDEIVDSKTYYYVYLNNHEPIDENGDNFAMLDIKSQMDECGVGAISGIQVFGVRKSRMKEISELDNWVWIEDKLKEETAKITDAHVASLVATEMLDSYSNRAYTNHNVARLVGTDSDYAKYVSKYTSIKRVTGNVACLVKLCGSYGKAVQVDVVKKQIENAKVALYRKYPMLKHISASAPEADVAEYIKMVDAHS
jgi:hypothetical protein